MVLTTSRGRNEPGGNNADAVCGAMRPKTDSTRQLAERLEKHRGASGIIYCASRKRTEELAREFSVRGRRALPYHAGL